MCPTLYNKLCDDTRKNIMGGMERHLLYHWEDFLEEVLP